MNVIPTKDKKFNGGGFTGMLIKGKETPVSDSLGRHLIDHGLAKEFKKSEVKKNVETN